LAGLLAAGICLGLVLFVSGTEQARALREERTNVLRDLALLRAGLEHQITTASSLGSVLMADIAVTGGISDERFNLLAREILAGSKVLRHVGLSKGMVVRWIHPLAGNESAIGLDYRDVPAQLDGIQRAIDERSTVVVGPLPLAQGPEALIIRRPIFLSPPDETPRSGPFWGMLSLVLRADALYAAAGLMEPDLPLTVALSHGEVGDPAAVFLGPPELFGDPDALVLPVNLPQGRWMIAGRPRGDWGSTLTAGPPPLLLTGLLLTLVVGVGTHGLVSWLARERDVATGLREANVRAERVLDELTSTRAELAQAERLSSLGALVESVTHDVSNPLSASLTAATFLDEAAQDLEKRFHANTLRRADMEDFLGTARQVSEITARNLTRAAQLIESFKQVAVDQASDVRRTLDLRSWLGDVRVSLAPRLTRTGHDLTIHCPDGVIMDTRPGVLFQVLTQLVISAIDTVVAPGEHTTLRLSVTVEAGNMIALVFQDESQSLDQEALEALLGPERHHAPLAPRGLASCHALVTGPLMGTLTGRTGGERGNTFVIRVPRVLPA
jgi:sensor domain CHASE-containing protein